jgi:hypothetical protein
LNSGVNERRGRGFFFPMLSMMDIILPGLKPLISDVRQSESSPLISFDDCTSNWLGGLGAFQPDARRWPATICSSSSRPGRARTTMTSS